MFGIQGGVGAAAVKPHGALLPPTPWARLPLELRGRPWCCHPVRPGLPAARLPAPSSEAALHRPAPPSPASAQRTWAFVLLGG